jgi:methionyl aminopeptidase
MGNSIEPGMTTRELDDIGASFLEQHGARSAPRLTYGFPGTTCISVNNEIAHGLPGDRKIAPGDMVNIDVSAELGGYFGDTGGSFITPPSNEAKERLCNVTRLALHAAMAEAKAGRPLNAIGKAIEQVASRHNLTIIRNLGSHGVGRGLHEEPKFIPPYYDPRERRRLREGMVITIEPFLSTGAHEAEEGDDGWTLYTAPRYLTAQFEHTIVITKDKPLVMTLASNQ